MTTMMTDDDELRVEARALRTEVAQLGEAITGLAHRADLERTVARMRRVVVALVVSFVLDLGLTGYLAWTNHRVNVVQERTSNDVLCPLYGLFLASYRPEAQPPERRAGYEDAFAVIRQSYRVLQCAPASQPAPAVSPAVTRSGR
jgi:hypothetical protein